MQKHSLIASAILVMVLLMLCVLPCIFPGELCRVRYGRPLLASTEWQDALRVVKEKMTYEEVQEEIGDPHEKRTNVDGSISWIYYVRSSLSPLIDGYMIIDFGGDGRVKRILND